MLTTTKQEDGKLGIQQSTKIDKVSVPQFNRQLVSERAPA